MTGSSSDRLEAARLRDFVTRVFDRCGCRPGDAETAADVLVTSDLRGIDSHGVARLPAYVELLGAGDLNPRPEIRVERELAGTAAIDGDGGLGLIVGPRANAIAMDKAAECGSAFVSVNNSSHYGIAGYYPLQAVERGLIGWSMTNASRRVRPLWAGEPMLGTNPVAVAFPAGEESPVVIDMATTPAPYGKVVQALREGRAIPEGWAVGPDGSVTTDPEEMLEGGALLPLGRDRERGGHKGYALGAMVDVFCGVLSGANWGPFVPPFGRREYEPDESVGNGLGHFFGALAVEGFMDGERFEGRLDAWIRAMRGAEPAEGTDGPLVPGDPERHTAEQRAEHGIPLADHVREDLAMLADRIGEEL